MRPEVSRVRTARALRARYRQAGGIALMTVMLLPILFGFGAFAVDLGRMYIYKNEIQTAMDSCALGASMALTGSADANTFDRARAYGLVTLDPSRGNAVGVARPSNTVNRLHFQGDNFDTALVTVEFSSSLGGAWVAGAGAGLAPQAARFVRCRYADADNPLVLLPVLRTLVPGVADKLTISTYATAGLTPAQSACAIPLGVCKTAGSTKDTLAGWGLQVGQRLKSAAKTADYRPGFFGWVDFTPPAGGANELAEQLTGSGSCSINIGDPVGQQGKLASLGAAWNSRFGLYGPGSATLTTAPPDFTGYGYGSTSTNNYPDYVTRYAARAPYQSSVPSGWQKTTSANHATYGQRRRVVVVPIVNCGTLSNPSGRPVIEDFACVLMLSPLTFAGPPSSSGGDSDDDDDDDDGGSWPTTASSTADVEYLGRASRADSPCRSSGLAGGVSGPLVPTLVQ